MGFTCGCCYCKLLQQKEELWVDLMSFVSKLNMSDVTDDIDLVTPEIHSLLGHLVQSNVDSINFTSFDVLVCRFPVLLVSLFSFDCFLIRVSPG